jgi:hypothetical protein
MEEELMTSRRRHTVIINSKMGMDREGKKLLYNIGLSLTVEDILQLDRLRCI